MSLNPSTSGGCTHCGRAGQNLIGVAGESYCPSCLHDRVGNGTFAVVQMDDLSCRDCGETIDVGDEHIVHARDLDYVWDDHSCSDDCDDRHAYCSTCGDDVYDDLYCERHRPGEPQCENDDGNEAAYLLCEDCYAEDPGRNRSLSFAVEVDGTMTIGDTEVQWQ